MKWTAKQRILLFLIPRLSSFLIRLLGCTLQFEEICAPGVIPGDRMPPPGVFAFWHRSLLMAAYRFRNLRIAILISQSFDGELIARTVERLGFNAVRGSSSRGGAAGLLAMETAFRNGHICAFTADGPRGPNMIAKPGVTALANRVGTNVGAFHLQPQRAWVLRSWDCFLIPKPFSRVTVTWPPHTPANPTPEATQSTLDEAVRMAKPYTGDL
ncbi:lysophospholipid acyltransferase family protein [Terriglobus albidus]|uniref:lysophospholipid acyltransferase family protein n=1 Tax=Terriglobus albidus TaxID=1592106 RepID=UPI0021DFCD89|nr:lysophospholipid acyltransferase family protein [Terriglobus albidus]